MKYAGLGVINNTRTFSFTKARICKQVEGGQAIILYTCLYLMGVEQFDENDGKERKLRSNFFNWFLFSMCVGSLLAVTFVVWIQDNKGWFSGFVLSIISIALV
ncbi:hypothetical protein SUGI_0405760 [Cryptomeria japonica]|nr:hypothetical protein SUGI_0405760 [Cryptomeria japonica]